VSSHESLVRFSRCLRDCRERLYPTSKWDYFVTKWEWDFVEVEEKENVNYIEAFNNAANKPYKLGINQFADLTSEEFIVPRNRFNGHTRSSNTRTTTFKYENVTVLPDSIDWRQKGAVTPIKNQGSCGNLSAWLFIGIPKSN